MIKKIFLLLLIASVLLIVSCDTSKVDDSTPSNLADLPVENKASNNNSIIQSISHKAHNGFTIKELTTHDPKEYLMGNISFVNLVDETVFIGMTSLNQPEVTILGYNLETNSQKEIYNGLGSIHFHSGIKIINDEELAIQLINKILFINRYTLEIISETVLDGIWEYDLSYDGTKIAYVQEGDLYISNLDLSDSKLLVNGVMCTDPNSDFYGFYTKFPLHSRWSHNNKLLLYIKEGYEGADGIGILDLDSATQRSIKFENMLFSPSYAEWFFHDKQILCSQMRGERNAILVDLANNELVSIEQISWSGDYIPSPKENKFVYIKDPLQLYMFNMDTRDNFPITPALEAIHNFTWSPDGKYIVVHANVGILLIEVNKILKRE
ncbi:MAG: PD40 domain-containing protein [Clostridia bacterium]|nr:PD40 domain-containing protein [Clostridia bacterium]MBS3970803.1 PD40 domain-containing protein [Clostridia bacterium]